MILHCLCFTSMIFLKLSNVLSGISTHCTPSVVCHCVVVVVVFYIHGLFESI